MKESLDIYRKLMCQYKSKWRIKIEETVTFIKSPRVTGRPPIKLPPVPSFTQSTDPPGCDDVRLVLLT